MKTRKWWAPVAENTHELFSREGCAHHVFRQIELSADNLREIETVLSKITVQGERYPAQFQQLVSR